MKLRYDPKTNTILLTHNRNWYNLPAGFLIEKPEKSFYALPFVDQEVSTGGSYKISPNFVPFIKNNLKYEEIDGKIISFNVGKIPFKCEFTVKQNVATNVKLAGNVPHYVLIGIINFINANG